MDARRTAERLRRHYWWPGLMGDVKSWSEACLSCAINKPMTRAARGVFAPNEVPTHRWEIVSMDFMSGIPKSRRGHDNLMIVVDRLTKRIRLIPTSTEISGEKAAMHFVEHIFAQHGLPRVIISDRDPKFTAAFWRRVHCLLGTRLMMSTADHPQTDGQSERGLRSISAMLRHYVNMHGDDWCEQLWAVEFAYNDAIQATTGFSPFHLDLGRDPASPAALLGELTQRLAKTKPAHPHQDDLDRADSFVISMRESLTKARQALLQAQRAVQLKEAVKPAGMEFAPGDYVFLRQDHLGAVSAALKFGPKWHPTPYRVTDRVGRNAYRLMMDKDKNEQFHPVVNVSKLKPAGEHRPVPRPLQQQAVHARVLKWFVQTEKSRIQRLKVKVSLDGFFSPGGLLVPSATERGGFDALDAYANDKAVARLPNRLGKRVTRSFVDPDGDGAELKVYRGLVIGFDPADQEQAFQIWYEDRDTQWIPTSLLDKLLVTPANDNQLAAMAANVLAAPNDF